MSEEIKVGVGVDGTSFSTGLEKLKEQSHEFGEDLNEHLGGISEFFTPAAAGALALAVGLEKVGEAVGEASEKAEKIQNLSERFGASAESIQRLTNAAEQNGATFDDVAAAYNKLEINSQKAIEGNKEMVDAFANIGISVDDLKNKSPDELMNAIADGTANATDKGQAYNDIVGTLGKSAGNLFDTFKLGSKQIAEVGDASGVMSDDTVAALDDMHKTTERFWSQFVALAGTGFVNLYRGLGTVVIVFTEQFKAMENVAVAFWGLLKDIMTNPFDTSNFSKFKDAFVQAIANAVDESKGRIQELVNPPKKPEEEASVRRARNADGEDKKAEKKDEHDEAEAARLREDAEKRDAERAEKAKSLEQQIADSKLRIAKQSELEKSVLLTDLGRAQVRDAISIEQDKLAELEKLQKEAGEKAKKQAIELAIDKKKDELDAVESLKKKDEDAIKAGKGSNPAVDDLRRIGGGGRFGGVAGAGNSAETAAKASLALHQKQVALLQAQLKELQSLNRPNMPSGNGAYSL